MTYPDDDQPVRLGVAKMGEVVELRLTILLEPVPRDGDAESNPGPGNTWADPSPNARAAATGGGGVTQTITAGSQGIGHTSPTPDLLDSRTPAGVRWDRVEQALTALGLRAPSHVGRAPVLELEGYERLMNLAHEGARARGVL